MNTSAETCPSLEDLAAFLDGRLSGDERDRVIAHLADCPSCYEVFTEAARYQLEEEEDEEEDEEKGDLAKGVAALRESVPAPAPAAVVPFPKRRIFRQSLRLAAALAAVALAVPFYQQFYTAPELSSQKLVGSGLSEGAAPDEFWSQWTTRGPNHSASLFIPHEFLLGAHLVDLRASLLRKDEQATDDALARINGHLEELGSRAAEEAEFYTDARVRLSKGQLPQDFLQQTEQMEARLTPEKYPYVAFGKWTEAGRLSALAQNPDFFQARENRKFLRAFLYHERDLESEIKDPLKAIKKTLDDSDPTSLPYEDLRRQFESILTHYQEESLTPI